MILDGGLATELERDGFDLNHPLWSARVVSEDPEAIRRIHLSYLEDGADLITTASYQMSFPGCLNLGMSKKEVAGLLRKAVRIAVEAREEFSDQSRGASDTKLEPLIAASIGPYGAYLANGAEYMGDYDVSKGTLYDFHIKRWEILADTEADLMACETIPSFAEAEVLLKILEQTRDKSAYISFSCKDGEHISDGTPIKECAELFAGVKNAIAVGINCTAPRYISSLIEKVREGAPDKEVVVYPNSGETYDAESGLWRGASDEKTLAHLAKGWFLQGARMIGGCCRTSPSHIKAIRNVLEF